jgi:CRP-like cAMP-binding protein
MQPAVAREDETPPETAMPGSLATLTLLRRNYLFRGLPEAALQRLAALATRRTYAKGAVIFAQGDPGDALYGVASGRIRISATAARGREVFLNIMEPGDTFGEIAVMDGRPRTAGARAMERSTVVVISRNDFLQLLHVEPQLSIHLLKLLCERLRWTSELVEESAFLGGPARLAKRLLILASLHGRAAGIGQLELRISQAELARFLGLTRQVVNHHLRDWRRRGWVELGRSQIVIRNAEALRRAVSDLAGG